MQTDINTDDLKRILDIAGISGVTGSYDLLGGGEGNDTFVITCGATKYVVRIAKYPANNNLLHEANALKRLNLAQVPKLVYYDNDQRIKNRSWIVQTRVDGSSTDTLSPIQYENLGRLLAHIHRVQLDKPIKLDFWNSFLNATKHFGDEQKFLNHTDVKLHKLIQRSRDYFQSQIFETIKPSLTHGDVSLNNMLVSGDTVSLIDWEFSRFSDPMVDFATMFYEDMAYNKGRWRIHITPEEKRSLFAGYISAGGVIDEQRLQVWFVFDKLGSAAYLYWKLHESNHAITLAQAEQYKEDYGKLTESLAHTL